MYREDEDDDRGPRIRTLYWPDEIIPISFNKEFDLQAGDGQSLHFENGRGLKHLGRKYLLADVAFYNPDIPMGSTIVFEMKGDSVNVVPDESEEIIAAYDAAEEAEYQAAEQNDEDFDDDDFGSKSRSSFDKTVPFINARGQRFPFRKVASFDIRRKFYLILNPQFRIPGFDPNHALVYQVALSDDDEHLDLILDEDITSEVFDQYNRMLDSKNNIGGLHDDDDDLF